MANIDEFSYTFPAIRGIQAGREYYVTMCPMRLIPQLFPFTGSSLTPEVRAQRVLNKARIPEMTEYLLKNPTSYVFSAITVSVDRQVSFHPAVDGEKGSKIGQIVIPMNARFLINDGQHRRAAIEHALLTKPELGNETIPVVIFLDAGLRRSQQLFADLNQHAIRPTKSLRILYDHREPWAQLSLALVQHVNAFQNFTETEKTSISNRSPKLFTLSNIHQATQRLMGGYGKKNMVPPEGALETAVDYWEAVASHLPEWQDRLNNKISSKELRDNYIHAHGIALQAFGAAGNMLLMTHPGGWRKKLEALAAFDWSRSNGKLWEGRAMIGGRISKSHTSVILTTNLLKQSLRLPLLPIEQEIETSYLKGRKAR